MRIISRDNHFVILVDKKGRVWLTKRIKLRRDSRRRKFWRKGTSVRFIPIKQLFMKDKKPYEPVDVQTGSLADFDNKPGANQDPITQLEGQ